MLMPMCQISIDSVNTAIITFIIILSNILTISVSNSNETNC